MSKQVKRSAQEKARVVLSALKGDVSTGELARSAGVSENSISNWKTRFMEGGLNALSGNGQSRSARERQLEAELEEVKTALGETHVELRVLRKKGGALPPF